MNYTFNNQLKLAVMHVHRDTVDVDDKEILESAVRGMALLSIASVVVLNAYDDGALAPRNLAAETAMATLRGVLAEMGFVPARLGTPTFMHTSEANKDELMTGEIGTFKE